MKNAASCWRELQNQSLGRSEILWKSLQKQTRKTYDFGLHLSRKTNAKNNKIVTINGKVNYYKGKYQITNPKYVSDDKSKILTINSKYSLTEGITEKKYDYLINEALNNIPDLKEWHSRQVTRKFNNISWKEAILKIHNPDEIKQQNKNVQRFWLCSR